MALYRVGNAGATVIGTDGALKAPLAPGDLVIPGVLETPAAVVAYLGREIMPAEKAPDPSRAPGQTDGDTDAEQEDDAPRAPARRQRGYDDKVVRPERGPTS